jgi:hypothetical protein
MAIGMAISNRHLTAPVTLSQLFVDQQSSCTINKFVFIFRDEKFFFGEELSICRDRVHERDTSGPKDLEYSFVDLTVKNRNRRLVDYRTNPRLPIEGRLRIAWEHAAIAAIRPRRVAIYHEFVFERPQITVYLPTL